MENKQMHNVLLPTKMYDLQLARLDKPIEILYHQDGKKHCTKGNTTAECPQYVYTLARCLRIICPQDGNRTQSPTMF